MCIALIPGIGKATYVYDIVDNMQEGECAETAKYPQGEIVTKVYDKAGRLSKVVACGDTTKYNYYDNGSVQSVVYGSGAKEEYTYTANNLLDTLTNKKADSAIISAYSYSYNNDSLQTSSTDALLHTTSFIYDRDGRLSTTKDPENYTTLKTYNNNGNISSTTDSNSNVTSFDYDEFNRLKTVTNALNEATSYTYDGNGNMLTQTDAKGNVTTCEYNSANLMIKIIAHGGRTGTPGNYTYTSTKVESYSYFSSGKIATKTDKNGNVTSYDYDAHGRVLSTACGTLTVSFTYDNNGNVRTMTDSTGTTEKSYDEFNRLLTKNVPGIGTIEYVYDITNGMNPGFTAQTTKYPSGAIVKKVYDKAGRLSQVVADNKTTQYNYYNNGSVQSVVYDGGASETYTYFADNQLETLVNKKADNTVIDSYSYTYDNANNMLSKTDSLGTTTYTYDALNRMLTESMQSNKTTEYTFDKAGNRASQAVTQDSVSTTTEYSYDSQNKLVSTVSTQNGVKTESVVYTYDYNGNNLEKRATPWVNGVQKSEIVKLSNTYDNFNQLVQSVTNTGVKVVNKYNGEGYRVEKTIVNGATTKYLYEGNKVVGEYDANGSQKAINVYGINLLMRIDVFNDYYYMYNGHADVTALLSASGTVDATYYFDAFGNVLNKTGSVKNSILYAGYQYDEETGLYYINARMYDPAIARFVQEDTYRGNPNDPLSLNLYAYCNNNPIKYIDPSGHSPFPLANGDYFSNGRNAGKYNPYVQQIQTRLQQVGCLGSFSDATDGRFGPKTKKAVQEYQRRNGLKQDGCVGPITWSYLFPDNAGSSGGNSGSGGASNIFGGSGASGGGSRVNESKSNTAKNVVSPVWKSSDKNYSPAVQSLLLELNFAWYFANSLEEQKRILKDADMVRNKSAGGVGWVYNNLSKFVSAAAKEFSWFIGGSYSANERDEWLELNQIFQSDLVITDDKMLQTGMFIAGLLMPGPGSSEANLFKNGVKTWIKHGTYNELRNTLGKEGIEKFIRAAGKGIVSGERENGIKLLSGKGISQAGKWYKYEIKVLGKGNSHYRLLGNFDGKTGHIIFEKIINKK